LGVTSRRNVLRAGGATLLAAVAGCTSGDGSGDESTTERTGADSSTTDNTSGGTTTTDERKPYIEARRVDPTELPDGARVAVASPELHQLVVEATETDGPVDLVTEGPADSETTLALGQFDYVRFQISRYEATASFASFAGEASYQYSLEEVSDGDGDVLDYASLTDSERAIADEMLESGSYSVGHHEELPAAAETFEAGSYLRADGTTYRIQQTVSDHSAHHMLDLEEGSPGSEDQVVSVYDRAPSAQVAEALTTAAESGSATLDGIGPVSEYIQTARYILAVDTVFTLSIFEPT
jgi:hypothetical protein